MNTTTGLLFSVAVLAVAGAGFAAMFALPAMRGRLFGAAVVLTLAALGLPLLASFIAGVLDLVATAVQRGTGPLGSIPTWVLLVVGTGYVALLVALARRRMPRAGREQDAEYERARSRQRRRVPARGEEL